MKAIPGASPSCLSTAQMIAARSARSRDSEEALRAIRSGEVDAVFLAGKDGDQVFTLDGADHAYRVLIESMNEGALTLTADKTISYANACFARMVKYPLEQVIGSSLGRFLSERDRASLRPLLQKPGLAGSKFQLELNARDGSHLPVQVSIRPLAGKGADHATLGLVVTDMTEARRAEEMLRALTHRVVQVQEAERSRVALELHDNITQLLCAVTFRSQTLIDGISRNDRKTKAEAHKLRELLGRTADDVERISRHLRPGKLEQLGLVEVIHDTAKDFGQKARVAVHLDCDDFGVRLPAEMELALYRILQEALNNVRQHARAKHVSVSLKLKRPVAQLTIADDGAGFAANRRRTPGKRHGTLGLLGMRERMEMVGGTLIIRSTPGRGTTVCGEVPFKQGIGGP